MDFLQVLNQFTNLSAYSQLRYAAGLFVLSIVVNLACFNWAGAPVIHPDSYGYISPASQLKRGRLPDFSLRLPTYPLYLSFMGFLGHISNRSPLKVAVCGQIVVGAMAVVLLYLIALKLLRTQWAALFISAPLSLNFQVVDYQSAVLTESLATTLLLAVLYVHIAAVDQRMTIRRLLPMLIADSALVMIRPSFIFLPLSLHVIHISYLFVIGSITTSSKNGSASTYALVFGMLYNVGLIASLIALYYLTTGQLGLSKTSEFNQLGKAIQYGYLDQTSPQAPWIARRAQEFYRELDRNRDPYKLISRLRAEGLDSIENLRAINSHFLAEHKIDFTIQTARLVGELVTKTSPFQYGRPEGLAQNPWLEFLNRASNRLHTLNGKAVIFAFGFAIYLLLRRRTSQVFALVLILTTLFYHLTTIAAFGYNEYSRLRIPVDLLLNLLVLLPFSLILRYVVEYLKAYAWKSSAAFS